MNDFNQVFRQVTSSLTLHAAYDRIYNNKDALLKDWNAGKDFMMPNGQYCSIRDIESLKRDASTVWIDNILLAVRVA